MATSFRVARPRPIGSRPALRAVRDGAVLAGLLFGAYLFLVSAPRVGTFGFDAFAYWNVDLTNPYTVVAGRLGAFTYTPVAARIAALASLLPFWQFLWLWDALLVATVLWLGGRRSLMLLAFPPVTLELYHGNVHLLIAGAIVLGMRYPVVWAFPILTKVTPGIGLIWFAVRREWRSLGIAFLATAILVAISLLIDGSLWIDWFASIGQTAAGTPVNQFNIPIPIWIRLPLAALIVAWGAHTNRRWTLAVSVALAMPVLWITAFAVLAAIPSLERQGRREEAARATPGLAPRPASPG